MKRVKTGMARSDERYFLYVLADRLNKTVTEIEALPNREVEEWRIFLNLEAERQQHAEAHEKALGKKL